MTATKCPRNWTGKAKGKATTEQNEIYRKERAGILGIKSIRAKVP